MGIPIFVDARYGGNHGIGRYASEVVPRLKTGLEPLHGSRIGTNSPFDALNPSRWPLGKSAIIYSPGYAVGFARARQVPTIHDLIHLELPKSRKGGFHRLYYERVMRPALRKSGHVLTVSESSAESIRDWLQDDSVRVWNAGNGCSDTFRPVGSGYGCGQPYVLYVGPMTHHKNPKLAFESMNLLPDLKFVVVTRDLAEAVDLASEYGLLDRTEFLTEVADEQLAAIYRGASALAFPSLAEGFGLPAVEALRCGTNVAYLAGCKSVVEICAGGQFGCDSSSDAEAFANCIEAAVESEFLPVGSLDRYAWANVAVAVDDVLTTIVAES